jgi:hypothetical protein
MSIQYLSEIPANMISNWKRKDKTRNYFAELYTSQIIFIFDKLFVGGKLLEILKKPFNEKFLKNNFFFKNPNRLLIGVKNIFSRQTIFFL